MKVWDVSTSDAECVLGFFTGIIHDAFKKDVKEHRRQKAVLDTNKSKLFSIEFGYSIALLALLYRC